MKKLFLSIFFFTQIATISAQPFVGVSGTIGAPTGRIGIPGAVSIYHTIGVSFYAGYRINPNLQLGAAFDRLWAPAYLKTFNGINEFSVFSNYYPTQKLALSPYLGLWAGYASIKYNDKSFFITPTLGFETGGKDGGFAFDLNLGYKLYNDLYFAELQNLSMFYLRIGVKYKF